MLQHIFLYFVFIGGMILGLTNHYFFIIPILIWIAFIIEGISDYIKEKDFFYYHKIFLEQIKGLDSSNQCSAKDSKEKGE